MVQGCEVWRTLFRAQPNNSEMGLNWGGIAPAWAGGYGIVGTFQEPNKLVGRSISPSSSAAERCWAAISSFLFVNEDLLTDYSLSASTSKRTSTGHQPSVGAARNG